MPFPVDNIRAICAQKGTSLKQIEKELGIGNGVIARWETKKGSPPYDRIIARAEHLNVPVSELTGEFEEKEKLTISEDDELDIELKEIWATADQEEREALLAMAKMLKARRNK